MCLLTAHKSPPSATSALQLAWPYNVGGHIPWTISWLALGLPVNQMEKQLAFCDVQRHFALWKTFRGIAITLPTIAIN